MSISNRRLLSIRVILEEGGAFPLLVVPWCTSGPISIGSTCFFGQFLKYITEQEVLMLACAGSINGLVNLSSSLTNLCKFGNFLECDDVNRRQAELQVQL